MWKEERVGVCFIGHIGIACTTVVLAFVGGKEEVGVAVVVEVQILGKTLDLLHTIYNTLK